MKAVNGSIIEALHINSFIKSIETQKKEGDKTNFYIVVNTTSPKIRLFGNEPFSLLYEKTSISSIEMPLIEEGESFFPRFE